LPLKHVSEEIVRIDIEARNDRSMGLASPRSSRRCYMPVDITEAGTLIEVFIGAQTLELSRQGDFRGKKGIEPWEILRKLEDFGVSTIYR
jgi:hypothetical protein